MKTRVHAGARARERGVNRSEDDAQGRRTDGWMDGCDGQPGHQSAVRGLYCTQATCKMTKSK